VTALTSNCWLIGC